MDGSDIQPSQWSNVCADSAAAMQAILAVHFPLGTILDVNFGLGVFYRNGGRERVTGVDIRPIADITADNKALPFDADSFDICVVDPPYKRGDGQKYEARYGKAPKTETQVTWSYHAALLECLRVAREGLIVKVQDGTDGHRFHARHIQIAEWLKEKTGLEPHDICINVRRGTPGTMAQGKPHFFKNSASYWLIYKWRSKQPFKPVRF